jgi:hypothetical protein
MTEADQRCLHALRSTDPRDDKLRIEATKDPLLEDSCSWIFQDQSFLNWWDSDNYPVLWVHGDPGKGKTMMLIAIINEVSQRLENGLKGAVFSYFFCQNTDQRLNTTTSVLRGLIFMLVSQQKALICHLRKRHHESGDNFFHGPNTLYALMEVLFDMLRDPSISDAYLMVDALDECDQEIHRLLERIIRNSHSYHHVKWLITSRNEPQFKEQLEYNGQLHTSLELNALHVSDAVNSFIEYKVKDLAQRKRYTAKLSASVTDFLTRKAEGTFLWVALVCKALNTIPTYKTESVLHKFPTGLEPLYERMMEQLYTQGDAEDADLCEQLLRSVTVAFRPLQLADLSVLADLPEEFQGDQTAVEDLIGRCGSFLTVREATVYFVHQSAKDYFTIGKGARIFPAGQHAEHNKIVNICFGIMASTLKRDICDLRLPGILIDEVGDNRVDRYLPSFTRYACSFWFDHLHQADDQRIFDKAGPIHDFCRQQLLHWLEALALMRRVPEAVMIVRKLQMLQLVSNMAQCQKPSLLTRLTGPVFCRAGGVDS